MPDLDELVGVFFDFRDELATFRPVEASAMPEVPRRLLAHHEHMTVTVESHHRTPVRVDVLQTVVAGDVYAREILLRRTSDDGVVQYGIVRLHMGLLPEDVQREITARSKPLGRILIDHDVMREVECIALWEVAAGPRLRALFAMREGEATYGRTALIHCGGAPAIELLEIVAPDRSDLAVGEC